MWHELPNKETTVKRAQRLISGRLEKIVGDRDGKITIDLTRYPTFRVP